MIADCWLNFQGLPEEFLKYMKHVRGLEFKETPNYGYLQGLFVGLMKKRNLSNDGIFDWFQLPIDCQQKKVGTLRIQYTRSRHGQEGPPRGCEMGIFAEPELFCLKIFSVKFA